MVLDADGRPRLADLPAPEPSLEVLACGLCGSDVEKLGRRPPGTVLGHEIAGELEDGSRVTVMHRVPCGVCERCRAGHQSTCGEFQAVRIEPGGLQAERDSAAASVAGVRPRDRAASEGCANVPCWWGVRLP